MWERLVQNLPAAAKSPYALISYVCLVSAYAYVITYTHRLNKVAKVLALLPEDQRAGILAKEYSTFPKSGLSPRQWLASRRQLFLFLAFLATVLSGTIVLIVSLQAAGDRAGSTKSAISFSGRITIQGRVRDKESNLVLKNAVVCILGRGDVPAERTDDAGNFVLVFPSQANALTSISIQVTHDGYDAWNSTKIVSSDISLPDILLSPREAIDGKWQAIEENLWFWDSIPMSYPKQTEFHFSTQGNLLLGTVLLVFPGGETSEYGILDGKVEADTVFFRVKREMSSGMRQSVVFRGKISGRQISFISQNESGTAPMRFNARKISIAGRSEPG